MIHYGVQITDIYLLLGLIIGACWGFVAGVMFSHWYDRIWTNWLKKKV